MINKSKLGMLSVVAVAMLLVVSFAPMLVSDDSEGVSATINLQPGQTWSWTPTFPAGLTPTVTVSASDSAMPTESSTFGATSGHAKVTDGKVIVTLPSDFSKSQYFVKVKAETTKPTQKAYYDITFNVAKFSMSYNFATVNAKVREKIADIVPTVSGATANSYALTGDLPAGLNFDNATGKITGTPTAYKAQADYTIVATLNTTPVQTVRATVSIGAYDNITASNYTVYAITNETSITVPGVSMPVGTELDNMTVTATKDSASVTVTAGEAYNGMTVEANTGKITGTPSVSGTYVFTENYTATASTGGSSASRTITVVVEDKVAISGADSFNSFFGHEDSITLTKAAGPSAVAWSIVDVKKYGTVVSEDSITMNNGVLKSSAATPAGTYAVTVKLATENTTVTTSGATGAAVADNNATKVVTIVVAEKIEISNERPITFYETDNGVYDELTLTSNIAGATFSVKSHGDGVTAGNISVSADGKVTPGENNLTAGNYTIEVEVKDPKNADNTATETINIVVVNTLTYTNEPTIGVLGA